MQHTATSTLNTNGLARRIVHSQAAHTLQRVLPPRLTIMLQFRYRLGYFPNLRRPRTFNEKIQYRKLHERDQRFVPLIDKIAVKDIVANILGEEWLIPTLWSGRDANMIPFDRLTPPYVVKASHASNCNIFVRRPEDIDREYIRAEAARWLKLDHASYAHEWAYSQVRPGILVEPYIGDTASLPIDLKFYVFHGVMHYVEVCVDRGTADKRFQYFDRSWAWQPVSPPSPYDDQDRQLPPPKNLDRMVSAAEAMAAPFGFARVDFYEVDDRPLFGEITFYPDAGYDRDHSPEFDRALGDLWQL